MNLLIVDDNQTAADGLTILLRSRGHTVQTRYDGQAAIDLIEAHSFDAIFTDLKMNDVDGLDVLKAAQRQSCPPSVIVITAFGDVKTAVHAMQLGAVDFLTKPVSIVQIEERLARLEPEARPPHDFVALSPKSLTLYKQLKQVASVPSPVWLEGELGVGRQFCARYIHKHDGTAAPFTRLVDTASKHWPSEGLCFLPNVDRLSLSAQSKLIQTIEQKRGSVRLISSASINARLAMTQGTLLPQLYYLLAVVTITLPALRQRREDIRPLFLNQLNHLANTYELAPPELSTVFLDQLTTYDWPGNIRELRNVAEQTLVVGPPSFPSHRPTQEAVSVLIPGFSLSEHLEGVEQRLLKEALLQTNGDRNQAGKLLSVERNALRYKLKKYGLLE